MSFRKRVEELEAELNNERTAHVKTKTQVEKLREALLHCKHRPHEHNPPADFTVTHCEVIDRALAETAPKDGEL